MKSTDMCVFLMDNYDDHRGGVTVVRECESHQGGVKGIRNVC